MASKRIPFALGILIASWALPFAGFQQPRVHADEAVAPQWVPMLEEFLYERKVATNSTEAARYFRQGLNLLYAFNHDEAIRKFRRATEHDPNFTMAWWGIAVANGPHINNSFVSPERNQQAWESLQKALDSAGPTSQADKALIEALRKRYANPAPQDRVPLDHAYADAMRQVWKQYPNDPDVGALFAESLMDLRPWDLWKPDGKPQPGTEEVVTVLEAVLAIKPRHPLALHLYIHAVEASPNPEKAKVAADRLRALQPELGHLIHMPLHIDVRLGDWEQAIHANTWAIAADQSYRRDAPGQDFYRVYMAHNYHMLAFAAMMRGQSELAMASIREMVEDIPPEWIKKNAIFADGFTAMPLEVLVRFGRWDEILAAPEPPDYLPLARCLRRCARGIAYAAQGKSQQAQAEQQAFLNEKKLVSAEATFGNNKATDLLAVAEHLLAGEVLYRQGKVDAGIEQLREAVKREDLLRYSEPPDWIHPVRHALGATLLHAGRANEAEQVYREDLAKVPKNVWSLYGLGRSLQLQGNKDEAMRWNARFQQAARDADVQITTSCFCQLEK